MRITRDFLKSRIKDERGMEMLQVAIIVLIAAALAAVIWGLASNVGQKISDAGAAVEAIGTGF